MFDCKKNICNIVGGISIAAVGYYLYSRNKNKVDLFLSKNIKCLKKSNNGLKDLNIEELKLKKEIIEELILKKQN